jgi:purine nucleoside permease
MDTAEMAAYRKKYAGLPKATLPPFVFLGDSLGSSNWWHGRILNGWANDWVKLWTNGKGNYAMTNREDNGIIVAVERLAATHRTDLRRLLFLRTASNYSMQAPGQTAESSLHAPLVGITPGLEACYRVGAVVVHELVDHWTRWEHSVPRSSDILQNPQPQ